MSEKKTTNLDPYYCFPKGRGTRLTYLKHSVREIMDRLRQYKTADRILQGNDESDRDELTYALFKRIASFVNGELVDREIDTSGNHPKITEGKEHDSMLIPREAHFYEIRSVLPSGYARAFIRLIIQTEFCIEKSVVERACREGGYIHELQSLYIKKEEKI